MKLEQQVVSLELAKKLKELGVKQESLWFWYENTGAPVAGKPRIVYRDIVDVSGSELCSAYTVAELGEMLPIGSFQIEDDKYGYTECHSEKFCGRWSAKIGGGDKGEIWGCVAPTEADARAKMLIYLIENKLINIEEHG